MQYPDNLFFTPPGNLRLDVVFDAINKLDKIDVF